MKRLEFDVKHGHYAHPDGRWVTHDDAIALARRVGEEMASQCVTWMSEGIYPPANRERAKYPNIGAIIAQALEDPEPPTS